MAGGPQDCSDYAAIHIQCLKETLTSPQEEEFRQKFEEESARLAADNEVLRKQLAEMAATMESVVQVKTLWLLYFW